MGRYIKCDYKGCNNNSGMKGINLHRFPREEERCQVWVKAAKNEKLVGKPAAKLYRAYLCNVHFQDWCFMNIKVKKRLVHNAMPDCEKPARKEPEVLDFPEVIELPDIASSSNATHHNSLLKNLLLTSTPIQKQSSSLKETSPMILIENTNTNCSKTTPTSTQKQSLKETSPMILIQNTNTNYSKTTPTSTQKQSSSLKEKLPMILIQNTNTNYSKITPTSTQKQSSSFKEMLPMIFIENTSTNCSSSSYNINQVQNRPSMEISTFSCSRSTQTDTYPTRRKYTPRETALAKKLKNCKDNLRKLQSRYEACKKKIFKIQSLNFLLTSQGVDEKLAAFIQRQVELSIRKTQGKRYSESDKMHAYQIYCASGAAYRALQGLLQLPSEHTLTRFISEKLSSTRQNTDTIDVAANMEV